MDIVNWFIIILLLILTAFFVATEFAVVKVRPSRIEQLIKEGNKNALAAKKVITHLDEYLSACQLGITITALGLGWIAEPTVEKALHPLFESFNIPSVAASFLSFAIAFGGVTFLHVVLGELAPKTVAIQKAEAVTLAFARPIIWFYRLMFPFIWVLNGSARVFLSLFGMKSASEHSEAHTEEELQILLDDSLKSGEINATEHQFVKSIFEYDETVSKDVMVPRRDMVVIDVETSIKDVLKLIIEEKYTRYPVVSGSKDHVLGFINAKDVTHEFIRSNGEIEGREVQDFIRPIVHVHEASAIHETLGKMNGKRTHMAIVIDDFGGTSGLLTIEDIMEEIVGEIRDEFDGDEIPDIIQVSKDEAILSGKVALDVVTNLFGIKFEDEDIDTISGWILSQDISVKENQLFTIEDLEVKVLELDEKYVRKVQMKRTIHVKENNIIEGVEV